MAGILRVGLLLLALGLVAAACMHEHSGMTLGEPGEDSEIDRTIEVHADEFTLDPDTIEVEVGETIEFVLVNDGNAQHEFSIGQGHEHHSGMEHGAATGSTGAVDPGDEETLVWTFTEAGEIQFACHIAGHDEQGMTGTLTVSE